MKLRNMKLSMKLGLVFAILFLMNAFSFALASAFVSNMQNDAAMINLSGIQRMNMERIYRLAQAPLDTQFEEPNKLLESIQQFEENLQKLQYGTVDNITSLHELDNDYRMDEQIGMIWADLHATLVMLRSETSPDKRQQLLASIKPMYDILKDKIDDHVTIIQEKSAAKVIQLKSIQLLNLVVNLVFVVGGLWVIISKVMKPLSQLIGKMNSLSEGKYRVEPIPINRYDEVGQLSKSFNSMLQNLLIHNDVVATGVIQRKLLPVDFDNEWLSINTVYAPQQFVSGDFIDFVWDEQRKIVYGFVVDIMGHGMAAALQASAMRVLLRQAYEGESLEKKLRRINNEAIQYFDEDTFAAVICFELDVQTGHMTIASGGINQVLLNERGSQSLLKIPGGFIGMFENINYDQVSITLEAGMSIIFATDGLLDVMPKKQADNSNFEHCVDSLRQLATQTTNRDDASAICIYMNQRTTSA